MEKLALNESSGKELERGSRLSNLKNEISKKFMISPNEQPQKNQRNEKEQTGYFLRLKPESKSPFEKKTFSDFKNSLDIKTSESKGVTDFSTIHQENSYSNNLHDLLAKLSKSRDEAKEVKAGLRVDSQKTPVRAECTTVSSFENAVTESAPEEKIQKTTESSENGKHHSWKNELKNQNFAEIVSVSKLCQLQDVFTDVSDEEFNKLPTKYISLLMRECLTN